MAEHYFSRKPQAESNEECIEVNLRGQKLTFYTDRGVFSKRAIDFGTQLLVETIQIADQAKVLDMGCGYGPIGLSLAKESLKRRVTLVDVNERALHLAAKNAAINQLDHVHIFQSNLFSQVTDKDFDYIISNPPIRAGKSIVHQLFAQSRDHLKSEGELWIVIQKKQGAPSAFTKLEEHFEKVEEVTKKKGYRIFRAKKCL